MKKIGEETSKKSIKRKQRTGDFISVIILILAIGVAVFAGFKLYKIFMEYKAGADEYASITDMVVKERDADAEKIRKLKDVDGNEVKHWTAPLDINFEELAAINEDVVGWIYMEGMPNVSYPIVKGEDNDFYLHHTYKKESVFAGSIFIDYQNTGDFSDQNTIVYGHNMKDGSMFGTLKNYKNKESTFDVSPYFWIMTPNDAYKYKIFSLYTAEVGSNTYTLIKGPGKETIEYGSDMKTKSNYETGEYEFKKTDKIVTLSTCTGNSATRFVVQGVRIDPE